jgi:hypothetical protein
VHADKAKQEETTTEESLEAKGALLVRALEESKVHFCYYRYYLISLYFCAPICMYDVSIGMNAVYALSIFCVVMLCRQSWLPFTN